MAKNEKESNSTLRTVVDKIKVQLFLFIIALAIIIASTAIYSISIAILITVLGYGAMVAYVYLEYLKYSKTKSTEPQPQSETHANLALAHAEICYYNENSPDPASKNRLEIDKMLAEEAAKSQTIKILINTGEPIFAAKTSYLNKAIESKAPGLVKVLLLDPKAKLIIQQRAKEAGYTYEDYKNEIVTSINFCKRKKIDCKVFNFLSPWRLFIFDDERVYAQFYLPKKSGDASPIYGYKVKGFDMGASFLQYFDVTYATSQAPTQGNPKTT
jgi:hypothetical protein